MIMGGDGADPDGRLASGAVLVGGIHYMFSIFLSLGYVSLLTFALQSRRWAALAPVGQIRSRIAYRSRS